MTRCNSVRKNMLLASLALALFAVGSAGYEYRDVYETLYSKAGYHAGTADTHGIPNVHTVQRKYMRQVESVLDVRRAGESCSLSSLPAEEQGGCEFLCKFKGLAHVHARRTF